MIRQLTQYSSQRTGRRAVRAGLLATVLALAFQGPGGTLPAQAGGLAGLLGAGAIEALAAADVAVPDAVGVMGFDDLVAGRFSRPPLTTIAPDPAEAGAALVEAVLDEDGTKARRRVPVSLIRRGSTAR